MKNKKLVFGGIAILLVALVGFGAWKFLSQKPEETPAEEEVSSLPDVDPSVEVTIATTEGNRDVILGIKNIQAGATAIDYELSYLTGEGLPKGAIGKIRVNGKSEVTGEEVKLGTCSRNVCKYDEGVTSVDLVLKFNHPDGNSQFQKSYEL